MSIMTDNRNAMQQDDAVDANPLFERVRTALDAFASIEGEKMLNALLFQLLRGSDEKMARHGVKPGHGENAELASLHAQLARLRAQNEAGSKAYRDLRSEADMQREALASIAAAGDGEAARLAQDALDSQVLTERVQ